MNKNIPPAAGPAAQTESQPESAPGSRRGFLFKTIAIVPAATALAAAGPMLAGSSLAQAASPGGDSQSAGYQPKFFNAEEWAFVRAAVDVLIPADSEGPGGLELNVDVFIDRQMGEDFGHAATWYMNAPFDKDLPPLWGYQGELAPRDLYRAGIAATNTYCIDKFGKKFTDISKAEQDQVLHDLNAEKIKYETCSAFYFFSFLLQNTKEGYLVDPVHGGNKDMGSWKMIGFPGARADFLDWMDDAGKVYPYGPVDISGNKA